MVETDLDAGVGAALSAGEVFNDDTVLMDLTALSDFFRSSPPRYFFVINAKSAKCSLAVQAINKGSVVT